jgi:hypothetical protein
MRSTGASRPCQRTAGAQSTPTAKRPAVRGIATQARHPAGRHRAAGVDGTSAANPTAHADAATRGMGTPCRRIATRSHGAACAIRTSRPACTPSTDPSASHSGAASTRCPPIAEDRPTRARDLDLTTGSIQGSAGAA